MRNKVTVTGGEVRSHKLVDYTVDFIFYNKYSVKPRKSYEHENDMI